MIFTSKGYARLAPIVFEPAFPGYRPEVVELPNGDGVADVGKRYAHVKQANASFHPDLAMAFSMAYEAALAVFWRLGLPSRYAPAPEACALRVLDYPSGAGSAKHTDFDLFTVVCYRDPPEGVRRGDGSPLLAHGAEAHAGELAEIIDPGRWPAVPHYVDPMPVAQRAIVFFALPRHDVVLPTGETVGAWVAERYARSRVNAGGYQ